MRHLTVLPVLFCLAAANAFAAGSTGLVPQADTFGTSSVTVYTIGAFAFSTTDSSQQTNHVSDYRYVVNGTFEAPVNLPNGALVNAIQIEGCDNATAGQVDATLYECPDGPNNCVQVDQVATGDPDTPGCGRFLHVFASPHQIDNATYHYIVEVHTTAGTPGNSYFGAVRLRYRLQVSPSPATATFSDVPLNSPLNKFVEALVSAGVTAGCGAGKFCPSDPVTRGRMAVFLATALGLHFPN